MLPARRLPPNLPLIFSQVRLPEASATAQGEVVSVLINHKAVPEQPSAWMAWLEQWSHSKVPSVFQEPTLPGMGPAKVQLCSVLGNMEQSKLRGSSAVPLKELTWPQSQDLGRREGAYLTS